MKICKQIILFCSCALLFSISARAQQSDISPETFGKLPEISDVEISPDGNKMLFLQNVYGKTIVVTRSLTDTAAETYGIPPIAGEFRWAKWISKDKILASYRFAAQRDGGRRRVDTTEGRLMIFDWQGKEIEDPIVYANNQSASTGSLFRRAHHVSQFQDEVIDFLEDDPEHILIQLDYQEALEPDVYKLNLESKRRERLISGRARVQNWVSDHNGVVRYGIGNRRNRSFDEAMTIAYFRKNGNEDFEPLFEYDELTENPPFNFSGFTADPAVIYISLTNEHRKKAYYTYNVDSEEIIEVVASSEDYDINSISIDDTGAVEYYTFVDDRDQIVRVGGLEKMLERTFEANFPGELIQILSRSNDDKVIALKVSSPTNPGSFYLLNLREGSMEPIAYNYAALDYEKLSPMTSVSYSARDGLEIPAYLSLPKNSDGKNLPMIIMPHGGPWWVRDSWRFDYWVQFLTTRGYAVLQMNFRGSSGYGYQFSELGYKEWGRKMLEDINDGAKWAVELGYADPDNMCIMGGSYGGYAALQAVVKDPGLYKCSISFAPITDLSDFMVDRRLYTDYRIYENYVVSDDWSFEEASPSENIDKYNIPILLAHGVVDRSVQVDQSRKFYQAMNDEGKEIKYIEFEYGNHFLSNEEYRIQFLTEVEQFLAKHLD